MLPVTRLPVPEVTYSTSNFVSIGLGVSDHPGTLKRSWTELCWTSRVVDSVTPGVNWSRAQFIASTPMPISYFRPVGRKWNGGRFVKKWTFPQRMVHYVQYQYLFILHYTYLGGVRTQRTTLPTGLYLTGYRHRGELGSLVLNTCIAVGVHTEVHCELQFSSCAVIRRLLCVPITALKRRSRKRMVVERRFCGLHVWTVIMIWHKVNLPVTRFSVNMERRGFLRDNLASYSTDGSVAC